jgi:hypothetical protein
MARIGVSKTRMVDLKELFSSLKKEMRAIITIVIQSNVSGKVHTDLTSLFLCLLVALSYGGRLLSLDHVSI